MKYFKICSVCDHINYVNILDNGICTCKKCNEDFISPVFRVSEIKKPYDFSIELLLQSSIETHVDKDYKFPLKGNIESLSTQGKFLQKKGFNVGLKGIYPCLRTEDEHYSAINTIVLNKVQGYKKYI